MIDIKLIRDDPEWVKAEMQKLQAQAPIDEILELDLRRRQLLTQVEELKAQRNQVSKGIGPLQGRIKKAQDAEKAELQAQFEELRQQMSRVGDQIAALDREIGEIDTRLNQAMLEVPNLPDESGAGGRRTRATTSSSAQEGRAARSGLAAGALGSWADAGHHRL